MGELVHPCDCRLAEQGLHRLGCPSRVTDLAWPSVDEEEAELERAEARTADRVQRDHGPNDLCPTCRDCTSCQGGAAPVPAYFRVIEHATPHAGIALHAQCTDCDGCGTTCLNLTQRQESA